MCQITLSSITSGLTLIGIILCLYTFGLIETVWHLPSPNHRRRTWLRKLIGNGSNSGSNSNSIKSAVGGNINLAKNGISDVGADDDENDAEEEEEKEEESADEEHEQSKF